MVTINGTSSNAASVMNCDKQNLLPSVPTKLSATNTALIVTLSWTDNSEDETGFEIIRKDSLTGSWSDIAITSSDATTYTDTVSSTGTYWKRY